MLLLSEPQKCTCAVFVRHPGAYEPPLGDQAYTSTVASITERKETKVILWMAAVASVQTTVWWPGCCINHAPSVSLR